MSGVKDSIRRAAGKSLGKGGRCDCADCVEARRQINAKYKAKRDEILGPKLKAEVDAILERARGK